MRKLSNLVMLLICCSIISVAQNYTQYVDPFIGTAYVGHTYPAATTPFGMVQVGPDNSIVGWDWEYCSGYNDKSTYITGFSHTHLSGTGCADMGDISFMPVVGDVPFIQEKEKGYGSKFSHQSEKAAPGYYSVWLSDYHIKVELTATPRAGFHQYTFPKSNKSGIMIDMEHGLGDKTTESFIKVLDNRTIAGFRRSTGFVNDHQYYFYARFSKPFAKITTYKDGIIGKGRDVEGKATKVLVQFATKSDEIIKVKVGLSTSNYAAAMKNLNQEIADWNFAKVLKQTDAVWNRYLSHIDIDAVDGGQRTAFYTSLYHALIMPNLVSDIDGGYVGWDHKSHQSKDGEMYTNFSLWDTYRALHPFLNLMYPEMNSKLIKSMLEHYKQTHMLPTNEYGLCETWCMIGNHAVDVIVDDYLKGDKTIDADLAYEAVKHSQSSDHNKSDWEKYNKYGYFPYDISYEESVSRTMEACYDDYCVAMMAKALNKTDDYNFFMKRSENYKNLFDPTTHFIRPRDSKGNWREPFNPFALINKDNKRDYTEGNAWQWTWHVQHHSQDFIDMFGSKEAFVNKLDTLFFVDAGKLPGSDVIPDVTGLIGLYAHGNEPSHHVAYLFNYAGRLDKTAEIVRKIFDDFYLPKRDGLCGNDDCGQMSAWYMFSGMGFYPVNPVSGKYVFGAPQLNKITLKLPNGKTFEIKANNLSKDNKYVKSIQLNGANIDMSTIDYKDIMKGGTLEYDMTNLH